MTEKIYLAGPMTGYPHFNFPAFHSFAAKLRAEGHEVFSPAERDIERVKEQGKDWVECPTGTHEEAKANGFGIREALSDDTKYICNTATMIAMMPGWENSAGANAEWTLAKALKLKFRYLTNA